jgi:sensor histidine kinase YesM
MIREVRLDHLSIGIGDSGDELIQIHRAFNSVFDRLKLSMELEVQARSRDLKARIDALESQVNPHFLYNVLAVIGSVGEQAGVDKVAELCGKLGGMFRYTLQHPDKDVTVGDEINYALLYLDLMKERFEDHFQYRLELDESALASKVPRLIFQPLIENCFRHAFVQCNPPWIIHLTLISTSEFLWLFEVKDWGDGFDPSVLEDLQRRMEANLKDNSFGMAESVSFRSREGVGLFNTFMRLQLTFQELAFYEIFSNKPNGTIIRIGVKQGVF